MFKIIPFIKSRPPKTPIPPCLHITDEVANQIETTMPCACFLSVSDLSVTSTNRSEKYYSGSYLGTAVGRPDTRQNGATWPMILKVVNKLKGGMNPNVLWQSLYSGLHPPAT